MPHLMVAMNTPWCDPNEDVLYQDRGGSRGGRDASGEKVQNLYRSEACAAGLLSAAPVVAGKLACAATPCRPACDLGAPHLAGLENPTVTELD